MKDPYEFSKHSSPSTRRRSRRSCATWSARASSRDRRARQLVRQPGARGADRCDRGAPLSRLPGDVERARAAGVPRVRAGADRVHELVRPAKVADYVGRLQSELQSAGATADVNILRSDAGLMTARGGPQPDLRGALRPVGWVAGALFVARKAGFDDILSSTWEARPLTSRFVRTASRRSGARRRSRTSGSASRPSTSTRSARAAARSHTSRS